MNGLRLVLVTRRFWPAVGGAETAVANLARGLLDLGMSPSIVTARLDAHWPSEVVCREVAVHRLPFPHRYRWGTMRYMIALSRWLRKNRPDIDLVCVSRMSHEAYATIGALAGSGIPVVLRVEADEASDLPGGAKEGRPANRILRRCHRADAVVAASVHAEQLACQSGFNQRRVHLIRNGVAPAIHRDPERRAAARRALAEVNEDLRVPAHMPVAVCLGQFQPASDFETVVKAWKQVSEQWPYARLWIIGDGPQRERLYREVRRADLIGHVLLPGTFDSVDEVLLAADILILPSTSCKEPLSLCEAMAAGLSVVASDAPGHTELVIDGVTGRLFPGQNPTALADTIVSAFNHPRQGDTMAAVALAQVRQQRALRDTTISHLKLFQQLITTKVRSSP